MASSNDNLSFASSNSENLSQDQRATKSENDELQENLDDTSSSGTSSDEDEDDSTDDEDSAHRNTTQPPSMRSNINNDLKARLSTFLPQMEKANRELEDAGDALSNRIDDVGEEEDRYIEMNLGLGVLSEEQDENDIKFENSSASDSDQESSTKSIDTLKDLNNRTKKSQKKSKIEEI